MNVAGFLQILATVSWLALIGSFVYGAFRASRREGTGAAVTLIIGTLVAAIALTTAASSVIFIQPEQRGVVISALPGENGVKQQALQPGLQWVVPFFQNVITYQISRQTYTMSAVTGEGQQSGDDSVKARTKDGQQVFIDSSVIYGVDPAKVVQVHITWQGRYQDELVRPAARGTIRDIASQYGIEEIVSSKRTEMEASITDTLSKKMAENGLILVDFVLRDIHFTDEYAASVEKKQIAEQDAQRAAFVVQQKQQEAEQARAEAKGLADAVVIRAKGQAEATVLEAEAQAKALALISQALKDNPELITFRYVEKLSPGIQVMLVPSNNPLLLPVPTLPAPAATPAPTPAPTTSP
ncbi:MAG: prohibitin family protein [Chloroflexi bacterium]|nr:prohibitin family protein [Chloroflexota bacterium]